jgi:hypothetical protein
MALSHTKEIDVTDHDGSTKGMYLGGTLVTATADELNRADNSYQLLVADGAITVKNGICRIAKSIAGVVAATLADPIDVIDDFKRLAIINFQTQANTVTSASSFGGGGASYDVATFTNVVGATLNLIAYNGKWYVTGTLACTLA